MTTTSSSLSLRKLTIACLLATVVVFGIRAIPSPVDATAPAKASVCGVPVVGLVCDVFSGTFGGIKFIVSKATGVIKDAVTKKVIGWVTKAGCVAGAAAVTDGIGAGVMAGICAKASDWLLNKVAGTGGKSPGGGTATAAPTSSTGNGSGNGSGSGNNGNGGGGNGSGNGNSSQDGTPASALSTAPMAALAGVATIFVADHISADTKANLTGGWFQSIYAGIENYAWLLAVIAVAVGALHIMATSWQGSTSGFGMLLARIPFAAILMVGLPVIAMVALQVVDQMSSDLMQLFPDGIHMLHIVAGILGVLGGASVLASLLHHTTIAHITGTGAWLIGAFGLLSAGAIALELIAREIAIYLTILVVPLALVGEIFSPFAKWATTLIKVLFVVIITKLFLAMGLVVAGTLMMQGLLHISPIMVIVGLVALILIALFPALIYGSLIRIESAWHSGIQHNAMSAPSHTMAGHLRTTHARIQTAMQPNRGFGNGRGPSGGTNGRGPSGPDGGGGGRGGGGGGSDSGPPPRGDRSNPLRPPVPVPATSAPRYATPYQTGDLVPRGEGAPWKVSSVYQDGSHYILRRGNIVEKVPVGDIPAPSPKPA